MSGMRERHLPWYPALQTARYNSITQLSSVFGCMHILQRRPSTRKEQRTAGALTRHVKSWSNGGKMTSRCTRCLSSPCSYLPSTPASHFEPACQILGPLSHTPGQTGSTACRCREHNMVRPTSCGISRSCQSIKSVR